MAPKTAFKDKDPAMGVLGYAREPNDHYATPPWVSECVWKR